MKKILLILVSISIFTSCATYRGNDSQQQTKAKEVKPELVVTQSVVVTGDGSYAVPSSTPATNPNRIITFTEIGQKLVVQRGETVNFIYDGIDPEETYITYESTDEGYLLELNYRSTPISITFQRLCHSFVVASPNLTSISVPDNLKYEQIIWTPREDGTWEVRIGTMERGCSSPALEKLNKLRTKTYEKSIPKK